MTRALRDVRRSDDEPAYEASAVLALDHLRSRIEATRSDGRCVVVAVDGRSAGGKTTLAERLVDGREGWSLLHTDDVAWHHSFFGWADLLVEGVLEPLHRDGAVDFRPPAWAERDRAGSVAVPPGARVLVVEGVGSSQRALTDQVDVALWVHTPFDVVLEREEARIAAGTASAELSNEWLPDEVRFLAAERPWSRADLVVAGTPVDGQRIGADNVVVMSDPAVVAAHTSSIPDRG